MLWRWIERRRLTIGFAGFLVAWYLFQLSLLSVFGADTALWWFYFESDISPGYFFAPVSHNMVRTSHLGANVGFLLIFGGFAEPYLDRRRYIRVLLGLSFGSIVLANVLSNVTGVDRWGALAGASGGILGLWAYSSVKCRDLLRDLASSDSPSHPVEAVLIFTGLFAPIAVPAWEISSTGSVNMSHGIGVLLGSIIGWIETLPQTDTPKSR